MGKSYRGYHPEQDFLLPPSLREWLPENHLVYFVSDVVGKLNLSTLAGLFEEVLRIALEAGALKLGQVTLDGTKVKANASKHKAMSYGRMKEREQQLRAEVRELLAQAEAVDA